MKICKKCHQIKSDDDFYASKRNHDGLHSYCKQCVYEYSRKWLAKRPGYAKEHYDPERARFYRQKPEAVRKRKEYLKRPDVVAKAKAREASPEYKAKAHERYVKNREKRLAYTKKYQAEHKDEVIAWRKEYYKTHKEENARRIAKYRKTPRGKEIIRKYHRRYAESGKLLKNRKRRIAEDEVFAYKLKAARHLNRGLKEGYTKRSHTYELAGCDFETFEKHLLATWKRRYGKDWSGEPRNIDHIVPLSEAKTKEEIDKLCHYTNLQLLTPEDNRAKWTGREVPQAS